jgi:excisionase family DNA binding protein
MDLSKRGGDNMSQLVKVQTVCETLQVSRATLYRLIDKGLPVVKVGRSTRFDMKKVQKWIEEQNK